MSPATTLGGYIVSLHLQVNFKGKSTSTIICENLQSTPENASNLQFTIPSNSISFLTFKMLKSHLMNYLNADNLAENHQKH